MFVVSVFLNNPVLFRRRRSRKKKRKKAKERREQERKGAKHLASFSLCDSGVLQRVTFRNPNILINRKS